MDQGSCGLGKTPRYRHNSWLCWSGLPQNSRRFVGGIVSCLSACVSKLGRAWFSISCSACTGKAWPRCRGSGNSWGICRNAIKPASPRSAPGSVGGLWQVITASGQAGPDVGKVKLRFGDASSGTTDQLQWPVLPLSTILIRRDANGRLSRLMAASSPGALIAPQTARQLRSAKLSVSSAIQSVSRAAPRLCKAPKASKGCWFRA